jgi:hypothetical protein
VEKTRSTEPDHCRINQPQTSVVGGKQTDMKSLTRAPQQGKTNVTASARPLQNRDHVLVHNSVTASQRSGANQTSANKGSVAADHAFHFGSVSVHPAGTIQPKLVLQPKLTIHSQGDAYEQEADRIADQVMHMPEKRLASTRTDPAAVTGVQRKCACGGTCADCNSEQSDKHEDDGTVHVQMKATSPASTGFAEAPPIVHDELQRPGHPLDPDTRAFMEPRFGHDFSQVRVHADSMAADSAAAINAHAYTVGNNVVFGARQFTPQSSAGRRLLGHELAHVVQQSGGASPTHLQRQPAPAKSPEPKVEKKQDDEETQRAHFIDLHVKQLRHVALCLDKARKLKTNTMLGPMDSNNIYRNVVEMIDAGKIKLTILTPTHYSTPDHQAYFDSRTPYPNTDGTYVTPKDPTQFHAGIDVPTPGEQGATEKVQPPPQMPTYQPGTKTEEHVPGEKSKQPAAPKEEQPATAKTPAAPAKQAPAAAGPVQVKWEAADVSLYLPAEPLITEDQLKELLIHEGVHVADWSHLHQATLSDSSSMLEEYKTEFRAYWEQPRFAFYADDAIRGTQSDVVLSTNRNCVACPPPAASNALPPMRSAPVNMKNKKQNEIFRLLIAGYTSQQFDCFYVCDQAFRKGVDDFDHPYGKNLVASTRIIDLEIEFRQLTPHMTRAEMQNTNFIATVKNLDGLDWAFLQDRLSQPFWDLLGSFVPAPISSEIHALAKKGTPNLNEIDDAWQRALKKLK